MLKRGKIETIVYPYPPLDVLLHVMVGEIIRTHVLKINQLKYLLGFHKLYSKITDNELFQCLQVAERAGLICLFNDNIRITKRAYAYYYSNLSTIPDVRSYEVTVLSSSTRLATLDERFVIEGLREGMKIILAGDVWNIVSINESEAKVYVEKADSLEGAVPVWTREIIPVDVEVAKKVGELRNEENMQEKSVLDYVHSSKKVLGLTPDQYHFIVEARRGAWVIHTCLGAKINNAFKLLIEGIFKNKENNLILVVCDAYRVFLRGNIGQPNEFIDSLLNTDCRNVILSMLPESLAFCIVLECYS